MGGSEAALLDIDGTLIESNDRQAYAWCEAFQKLGYAVGFSSLAPLIGMRGDAIATLVTGLPPGALAARELVDEQARIFRTRYLRTCHSMPGARALLDCLHGKGLALGALTAGSLDNARDMLEQANLLRFIDTLVAASSEPESAASDAGTVAAALLELRASAARAVLIGDSPHDVELGARAEVDVIALRCGGYSDSALEGASAIFDHPRALTHALAHTTFSELLGSTLVHGCARLHVPVEQHLQL